MRVADLRAAVWLPLLLSGALSDGALAAQTVRGTVREGSSERPVTRVRVALLDTAMQVVASTVSDQRGAFVLSAPAPGSYWLSVDRLGYRAWVDGLVELGEGGLLPVTAYMKPDPVDLEGLTATVRRRLFESSLESTGFHERLRGGLGRFITPEEVLARQPRDVPDLLRRIPGLWFDSRGVQGDVLYMRSGRGGSCEPRIFVDGAPTALGGRHEDPEVEGDPGIAAAVDEVIRARDVIAVEVYSSAATVPLQWGGSRGTCGVIVFWSHR